MCCGVNKQQMEFFQDDIYVPTRSPEPWFTADEWFAGAAKEPVYVTMQPAGMLELSKAPKEELTEAQKKYQDRLEQQKREKETQLKGATGHTSAKEVSSRTFRSFHAHHSNPIGGSAMYLSVGDHLLLSSRHLYALQKPMGRGG
jgi:hypothetical protein